MVSPESEEALSAMTNLDTIKELYRSFREADHEAFRSLCSENVEWIQNEGFPGGKTRRGVDAIIEGVFKGNRNVWEGFAYNIEEMLDAGTSVVVVGTYEGRNRLSGKYMKAAAAHLYDLENGRVIRFRMYADTKTIWDAMA